MNENRADIPVLGMKCQKCVAKLTAALTALAGVESVEVSLDERRARVLYDPSSLDRDALADAIRQCLNHRTLSRHLCLKTLSEPG